MRLNPAVLSVLLLLSACVTPQREEPPPVPLIASQEALASSVLVEKANRKMYLLDQAGMVIKSYDIVLGKNPEGRKIAEGDGRTPEGRYVIDARNENSEYHLSLRISYPSPEDRALAKKMSVKPGGDIFIHGFPNDKAWQTWKYNKKNDWTEGCIAVDNDEIREIWALVPDGTPITITP